MTAFSSHLKHNLVKLIGAWAMALNQAAINKEVVNGSAGGNVFLQALSAISTSLVSLVKGIPKTLTYSETILVAVSRSVALTKSVLSTSTNLILKSLYGLLNASSSVSVSFVRSIAKTLTSTAVNSVVSLQKVANHLLTLSVNNVIVATIAKYVGKLVLEAEVVVATILMATNRLVTF